MFYGAVFQQTLHALDDCIDIFPLVAQFHQSHIGPRYLRRLGQYIFYKPVNILMEVLFIRNPEIEFNKAVVSISGSHHFFHSLQDPGRFRRMGLVY